MQDRYLKNHILSDLKEKMVFVGGPRQVGKTTMALSFLKNSSPDHPAYQNWDSPQVKLRLRKGFLPESEPIVILDEIHKYKGWRNLVKGFYDTEKHKRAFLITGSARLDHYRKGGDSLQGRYHYYRLHPFSPHELDSNPKREHTERLLKYGGFPAPLFKASQIYWQRWQNERYKRVTQEDLIGLEQIKEISLLEILLALLPERVGSLLSVNNLRQELETSFETVDRWIGILENIYHCFRIRPWTHKSIRGLKKEKKLYLWDWSMVPSDGAKFENLVASLLLKYCHYFEDIEGENLSLNFLRDKDKRELDFIVARNGKPLFAVECKSGEDGALSKNIVYFSERINIPKFFQVHLGTKNLEATKYNASVLTFEEFARRFDVASSYVVHPNSLFSQPKT